MACASDAAVAGRSAATACGRGPVKRGGPITATCGPSVALSCADGVRCCGGARCRFGDSDGLLLGDTTAAITGEPWRGGRIGASGSALGEPG